MGDYSYTPIGFVNNKIFDNTIIFSRELTENERWAQGAEDRLEHFFKHEFNTFTSGSPYSITENQTRYWKTVSGKTPRVHCGLPKLASNAMVKLITSGGIEFTIEEDEENTERLDAILNDNNFNHLIQKGVFTESWAGFYFYKITKDQELSPYPILEIISPKDGEAIVDRGRIKGFIFKSRFTPDGHFGKTIEIREIYEYGENGRVSLIHEAYTIDEKGNDTKLDSIPKDYIDDYEDIPNIGITFLPGELKNNTVYNSRFPNSIYGESDYTSVQALFHDIDDMYSQRERDVNNARAIKFLNEKIIHKTEDGKSTMFDDYQDEIELLSADMDMDTFDINKMITILQPDLRVEQYDKTIKELKADICNGMGLDPETLGMVGFQSINSAAESKRQSQATSLDTREAKIKLHKEILESLGAKLLMYDDMMNGRSEGEYEVVVSFGQYMNPTMRDRVDTVRNAIEGKVMDIATGVEELYGEDKTEEEKALLVRNIKLENNLPLLDENLVVPEGIEFEEEVIDEEQPVEDEVIEDEEIVED